MNLRIALFDNELLIEGSRLKGNKNNHKKV